MKTFKYLISTLILIAVAFGCEDDNFGSLDFVGTATAPTNVTAQFKITQDNTGLVSVEPSADGAVNFVINYGDGTDPSSKISAGKIVNHTYAEGSYTVGIAAYGVTGLKTEVTKDLMVSFQPPQFGTDPIVENDAAVSKQVNVTVPGDTQFAMYFDVHFVENGIETIISGNVGETVSYIYTNPGLVDIKIVLKGGAIATTEYIMTDFEVTQILQPIESAPYVINRNDEDYISIFSDAYTDVAGTEFNPWWWQATVYSPFELNGDNMLTYANLNYQGIEFGEVVNASEMEFVHLDVWTADLEGLEFTLISQSSGEKFVIKELVLDGWNSFDIPLSEYTDQGLTIHDLFQFKFAGSPYNGDGFGTIFVDNLYFWKTPSERSPLEGTWVVAPETGAIAVGPSPDDLSWWYLNQWGDDVTARACWLDDEYVFMADGTFMNVLGSETWLEPWQGVDPESCGAPIAPHDGSNPATWSSTENTITISGEGAYLGLAKVHNNGEDGAPPSKSVTYDYVLSEDGMSLDLKVVGYNGTGGSETWYFKLIKKVNPLVGTWRVAPENGAIAVGPSPDDLSWWYLGQWGDDVTTRACWLDDEYIFNEDGTFQNVLGSETWLEPWQGVDPEACGTPIAPHDGSNPATWSNTENTVTVSGVGAFLGLAKVHNTGENGAPPSNSITYDYELSPDGNTMELKIVGYNGTGGTETWYIKMVKQ